MNTRKYTKDDIERLKKGEITTEDMMKKYGVSKNAINLLRRREGIRKYKPRIRITSPYKTLVVRGKSDCAFELGITPTSVSTALKGGRVKVLEELNITLSYVEEDND